MQPTKIIFLFIGILSVFYGCTDETDYNHPTYLKTREELTDKKWERSFTELTMDIYETWTFESNGNGSCQVLYIYDNGAEEEWSYNFLWALTLDLVIDIDNSRYWEIQKITPTDLTVQETWQDPVEVPGQTYRESLEFKAVL